MVSLLFEPEPFRMSRTPEQISLFWAEITLYLGARTQLLLFRTVYLFLGTVDFKR
ncbi:hypothetical protein APX70_01851 [Pseudomonas syringae pv. maculicola]|uniref:Uncharacterized protein n=1 Tax=Pseudomonas syringae pv. maculicola TaxID=59511 RepID=A0A3M2U1H2_PSEYM|nr:hypothetical protein APX70_01851 [Pseudomonas syringae pv. maculicola]